MLFRMIDRLVTSFRIGVLGDIMLDEYSFGEVKRISPEAPVPVFLEKTREYRLGGAANVAANFIAAGSEVFLWGAGISKESVTHHLLEGEGIKGIWDYPGYPIVKKRLLAMGQQILRVDKEVIAPLSERHWDTLCSQIGQADPDALILADYNKGMIPGRDFLSHLVQSTRDALGPDVLIGADPHNALLSYLSLPYPWGFIKCNLSEFSGALSLDFSPEEAGQIGRKMLDVCKDYSLPLLVVTLGSHGALVCVDGNSVWRVAIPGITVYDVTGAGDSTLAYLALGLLSSLPPPDAVLIACLAGRLAVSYIGTAAISLEALRQDYALSRELSSMERIL